jgi:RimJ/RimL family protein N-acetyltransferase
MNVPELRTERLLMRGFRDEDLDAMAEISADGEVTRWVGDPDGLSREETWRRMAYFIGHWELRGFGQWALCEQTSGELVGRAGLLQPEGWPGLEVG